MKQYSKVKVLRFEGYGAEKKCQSAVNQGIDRGWHPINMNSYISTHTDNLVVLAFMGKLKETGEEEIKYEVVEGEPEEEEIEETSDDTGKEKKRSQPKREERKGKASERATSSKDLDRQKKRESKKEDESYEKCPRCGNVSLEIKDDNSAVCQYCGHLIDDIHKQSPSTDEEQKAKTDKPTF